MTLTYLKGNRVVYRLHVMNLISTKMRNRPTWKLCIQFSVIFVVCFKSIWVHSHEYNDRIMICFRFSFHVTIITKEYFETEQICWWNEFIKCSLKVVRNHSNKICEDDDDNDDYHHENDNAKWSTNVRKNILWNSDSFGFVILIEFGCQCILSTEMILCVQV